MLATPSSRSRIYLDMLERHDMFPEAIVLLEDPTTETAEQKRRQADEESTTDDGPVLAEDPGLDVERTVRQRVADAGVSHHCLETLNPNNDEVIDTVAELDQRLLVYSGPGGVILDGELLSVGPRFLHVHAGRLPDYRGSTTVYYSLLDEGQCGATAFIMNEDIDKGPIVAQETYSAPQDPETLDLYYDPWIRSRLLVSALSEYRMEGSFTERPQQVDEGETYFIVHPVLKHLALLRAEKE